MRPYPVHGNPNSRSKNRRILLLGPGGLIGQELSRSLQTLGQVVCAPRNTSTPCGAGNLYGVDLANPDTIRAVIRQVEPALIVNAAAYTAVDRAENEPDLALAVNGTAPGILAEEAKQAGAVLVHYSTDYVFDGGKRGPYTEEDTPNPINTYGRSKLAGEQAITAVGTPHLILRTGWVYGARGKNILNTIIHLLKERDKLPMVEDRFGAPTWSRNIARATSQILGGIRPEKTERLAALGEKSGIYHLTSAGHTTWYGFALAVQNGLGGRAGHSCEVVPIPSEDYPTAAARPRYSILSNVKVSATFQISLPPWDRALGQCLAAAEDSQDEARGRPG